MISKLFRHEIKQEGSLNHTELKTHFLVLVEFYYLRSWGVKGIGYQIHLSSPQQINGFCSKGRGCWPTEFCGHMP